MYQLIEPGLCHKLHSLTGGDSAVGVDQKLGACAIETAFQDTAGVPVGIYFLRYIGQEAHFCDAVGGLCLCKGGRKPKKKKQQFSHFSNGFSKGSSCKYMNFRFFFSLFKQNNYFCDLRGMCARARMCMRT